MVRSALLALAALALAACGPTRDRRDDGNTGDDECAKPCGTACCTAEQVCDDTQDTCVACAPRTCAELGKNCGLVADGCGGSVECGACSSPQSCGGGGVENVCGEGACRPRTCAELGKNCGTLSDGCTGTLDCGTCPGTQRCGGGGANVCGTGECVAETDRAFCTRLGKNCGVVVNFDNCDASRTVNCGPCDAPQKCGTGSVANVCCLPESNQAFCTRLGKNCGDVSGADNCGEARTANCGSCPGGARCGSADRANVCCAPESDAQLCARMAAGCGTFEARDACGQTRTITCGSCVSPYATCGGAGVEHQCGGWEQHTISWPSTPRSFYTMWGTGTRTAFAIGGWGAIARWNGSAWTLDSSPSSSAFYGIWGTSEHDVWVVGMGGTILRWNGFAWMNATGPTANDLYGVRGLSTDDVWAVGKAGTILRYAPTTGWTSVPAPAGHVDNVNSVWPFSSTNAVAIGNAWTSADGITKNGSILRWNGTAWTREANVPTTNDLYSLWAASPTDMWAVGPGGTALHFDGTAWTATATGTTSTISEVWGRASNDVWAVGKFGLVLHWDGRAWTKLPAPQYNGSPTTLDIGGVWAGANDVWIAGGAGAIWRFVR